MFGDSYPLDLSKSPKHIQLVRIQLFSSFGFDSLIAIVDAKAL
jgi:hypothetical protein